MPPLTPNTGGFVTSPDQQGTRKWTPVGPPGTQPGDTAVGNAKPMGDFVSTAYGPPWNAMNGTGVTANGTDLRPAKKVFGVAVDPSVIPLGTFLHIQPNPFGHEGTFKAFDTGGAIKGKRIDFYDWRGRKTQMAWGRKTVKVYKAGSPDSKMKQDKGGGGISIPNPLGAVDDIVDVVKTFVSFVLSPKSLGDLLAKVFAYFVKLVFKALWNYVFAPILHWHQRAVLVYYRETMLEKKGFGGFVTMSLWATGYAILWAQLDKDRKMVTEPSKTPLGSLVRSVGNSRARRKLVKPKDVEAKTPKKPEPVKSQARIVQQGTMTATRRRTVQIGGTENGGPTVRSEGGVRDGDGDTAEATGAAGADGASTA